MELGEFAFVPKPLSVITQKVPSAIFLMPEWPWTGWPRNGYFTAVGRPNDLPSTEPAASTRLPAVNLPDVFRSAGASAGASMKVSAGMTTCPASVAGYGSLAIAGQAAARSARTTSGAGRMTFSLGCLRRYFLPRHVLAVKDG